jgi:hypothetical protein
MILRAFYEPTVRLTAVSPKRGCAIRARRSPRHTLLFSVRYTTQCQFVWSDFLKLDDHYGETHPIGFRNHTLMQSDGHTIGRGIP